MSENSYDEQVRKIAQKFDDTKSRRELVGEVMYIATTAMIMAMVVAALVNWWF